MRRATRASAGEWRSRSSPRSSRTGSSAEARAIAALNHPHICTLYDIGPDYLVMEHVEGESRSRGPLKLDDVLENTRQICDATMLPTARASSIAT